MLLVEMTRDWFTVQLVMRKIPKPSTIGTELLVWSLLGGFCLRQCFKMVTRSQWIIVTSKLSLLRIQLLKKEWWQESQHWNNFQKLLKSTLKPILNQLFFPADFLERSLDPTFLTQVRRCFGESILALHGYQRFLDPEDFEVADALRNNKGTSWATGLLHGGLSELTFVFPYFEDLEWIVDKSETERSAFRAIFVELSPWRFLRMTHRRSCQSL